MRNVITALVLMGAAAGAQAAGQPTSRQLTTAICNVGGVYTQAIGEMRKRGESEADAMAVGGELDFKSRTEAKLYYDAVQFVYMQPPRMTPQEAARKYRKMCFDYNLPK